MQNLNHGSVLLTMIRYTTGTQPDTSISHLLLLMAWMEMDCNFLSSFGVFWKHY